MRDKRRNGDDGDPIVRRRHRADVRADAGEGHFGARERAQADRDDEAYLQHEQEVGEENPDNVRTEILENLKPGAPPARDGRRRPQPDVKRRCGRPSRPRRRGSGSLMPRGRDRPSRRDVDDCP
jgi:hypothetical protein